MTHEYYNNSNMEIDFKDMLDSLMDFATKRLNINSSPIIHFDSNEQNAAELLGKTGYYDPESYEIHIYVDGRHPKDIMRSLSHELVHHSQNEQGILNDPQETCDHPDWASACVMKDGDLNYSGDGYAQKNPHLRRMETEANNPMLFRDWEDNYKLQQENKMTLKEWRLKELQKKLMERFGIKAKPQKDSKGKK